VTQTELRLDSIVLFVSDMAASGSFYGQALGLRAVSIDPHVAIYSAGHVQLCLLPAAEHGVALQEGRDRSADITFMVDDFHRCREVLMSRGVQFSRTLEYSIGVTADFYDPDGHWFSLYQASDAARGWPSGPKLDALATSVPAPEGTAVSPLGTAAPGSDLADAFIPYVFLFFSDPVVPAEFYGNVLGLEVIEGGPCRRVPTNVESGVVKYDAGTAMLTTHHVESDDKRFRVATVGSRGVALSFAVPDLPTALAALSSRGIVFSDWLPGSRSGRVAQFADPAGHVFLLRAATRESREAVRAEASGSAVAGV
jgi:catechol 2,3-dioxygenase-like lactoylglutathione lyase family enzyme